MMMLPLLGGSAVMVGALLPWMTFFAGLQRVSGVTGLYGRLLLGAGAVACVLAVGLRLRRATFARWVPPVLMVEGAVLFGSAIVLAARAWTMVSAPGMAMMVPAVGPGLFVVMGGALLLMVAGRRRGRA
jgi:hypothetical protein